jgi:hypothetical protein
VDHFARDDALLDDITGGCDHHGDTCGVESHRISSCRNIDYPRPAWNIGLYQEFDDARDFRAIFARHLAQTINSKYQAEETSDESMKTPSLASFSVKLSDEAAELLVEATKDRWGAIVVARSRGGTLVQTNSKDFSKQGDARSEALWEGAVSELEREMLVEDRGHQREVFTVTSRGYQVADTLAR